MTRTTRISDLIIPKFWPAFNDREHTHKILTSGRAGTKSSEAAIEVVYKIVSEEDCSAVVIRKRHNKLRKTVYKEIKRAIKRLGLPESLFKITVSPMEITYKPNGNTIYFTGSDSIDDTKGYAIVEGSEAYEVEFVYRNGEISHLICSCFCSYNCKHEFAAMLQLRETLELIEKNYGNEYERTGYFAAVNKGTLFAFAIDGKDNGSFTL